MTSLLFSSNLALQQCNWCNISDVAASWVQNIRFPTSESEILLIKTFSIAIIKLQKRACITEFQIKIFVCSRYFQKYLTNSFFQLGNSNEASVPLGTRSKYCIWGDIIFQKLMYDICSEIWKSNEISLFQPF